MIKKILFSILILLFSQFSLLESRSIEVLPSIVNIQNLKPGNTFGFYEGTGLAISIPNSGGHHKYIVEYPSDNLSKYKPFKGYLIFPQKDWIHFSKDTIELFGNDTGYVNFYLNIPDEPSLYNQSFELPINVIQLPGSSSEESNMELKLGVSLKYFVETHSVRPVGTIPYGPIGIVPHILRFGVYGEGEFSSDFVIYNNDNKDHVYHVYTYIPKFPKDGRPILDIPSSNGGYWIQDPGWVRPFKPSIWSFFKGENKIKIKPGTREKCSISINIPKSAQLPKQVAMPGGYYYTPTFWEAIIMVESDNGQARFCRVKMFPIQK
ncbi:hypothetical protein JW877_10265, partial [bacterium]|nr:hypothetical protein [bacterium]